MKHDFLIIHVANLLKLEQADIFDLEIYRAFIKLLDKIERKALKNIEGKRKDRENEERITNLDTNLLVVTMVYFFVDEE